MPYHQHPFEFWGQALLNAAEWQRQIEWLMRLAPATHRLTGPSLSADNNQTAPALNSRANNPGWTESMAASRNMYEDWLKMCGWVPRKQYDDLQARLATLERRCARQKEMIARLRRASEFDPQALFEGFSQYFARQSGEFRRLMENLQENGKIDPHETENGDK